MGLTISTPQSRRHPDGPAASDSESSDWIPTPLGDLGTLRSGGTPSMSNPRLWNGDIPWVSPKDMKVPRLVDAQDHVTPEAIGRGTRLVQAGAVLIVIRGMILAHSFPVAHVGRPLAFNQDIKAFICGERLSSEFLLRWLEGNATRLRGLATASTHGTMRVPTGDLLKTELSLPPVLEQNAIAAALSDVDGLIASLDRLIAKKRAIKQAAMQQLLTGKTRLPGFKGKWAKQRLGAIARITMGRTPSRGIAKFWGPGHRWLAISDLQERVISDTAEHITDAGAEGIEVIPAGTLVMSFKLSIGRVAFTGADMYSNEAICALRSLQVDPVFMYYALQRVDFSLYGKQAVKGYTLNKQSLKTVEVYCPPEPAEQQAVGQVLREIDEDVEAAERCRDKAKAIKQGMMQALLTGRVRLLVKAAAGGTP